MKKVQERLRESEKELKIKQEDIAYHKERLKRARERASDYLAKNYEAEERGNRGLYTAELFNAEQDVIDAQVSLKEAETSERYLLSEIAFLMSLLLDE